MNAYNEIDGIPCGADEDLLTRLLRDEWGFGGTVVSDYWAIAFLASTHNIASDVLAAAQDALRAGIDVELPHTSGYGEPLRKMVENGQVPADLLDRAALRVLTQKAELGLLDPNWKPSRYEIAEAEHDARFDSPSNQTIARRLAEESIVLLDNPENLLPLATPRSIAVIGPTADDAHCLFGCCSFPNHVLPHHPDLPLGVAAQTLLDAVRAEFPDAAVRYEQGCAVNDQHRDGFPAAIEAPRDADLTILVVGDRSGLFGHGTSGEGCDVASLDPPSVQAELGRPSLRRLPQDDPRPTLRPPLRNRPPHQVSRSHHPVLLPRPGRRSRNHRRPIRPCNPLGPTPSPNPRRRVEPTEHLPGPSARTQERRRQQHRPDPRLPLRPRPDLHDVHHHRRATKHPNHPPWTAESPSRQPTPTPDHAPPSRSRSSTSPTP